MWISVLVLCLLDARCRLLRGALREQAVLILLELFFGIGVEVLAAVVEGVE